MPIKSVGSGHKIESVGLAETQHFFSWPNLIATNTFYDVCDGDTVNPHIGLIIQAQLRPQFFYFSFNGSADSIFLILRIKIKVSFSFCIFKFAADSKYLTIQKKNRAELLKSFGPVGKTN